MALDEFDQMKDADSWDTMTRGQYKWLRTTDALRDQPTERPWYDRHSDGEGRPL